MKDFPRISPGSTVRLRHLAQRPQLGQLNYTNYITTRRKSHLWRAREVQEWSWKLETWSSLPLLSGNMIIDLVFGSMKEEIDWFVLLVDTKRSHHTTAKWPWKLAARLPTRSVFKGNFAFEFKMCLRGCLARMMRQEKGSCVLKNMRWLYTFPAIMKLAWVSVPSAKKVT